MAFQKAVKSQAKLRLTFDGPAGSGKTYSSLVLARELAGPSGSIAVIDTEHRTASKYAGIFNFDQQSPDEFSLDTYLKLIREAKGYDVLVIDSLSHAWMGKGGAMEEVDRSGGASNNKFAGWRFVTPKHNELIDAIIGFPGHVICTMRKKMEYVLETDSKGRQVPKKVGMAPVQREGMEYEFDVVADLDTDGNITIAKTRCPDLHSRRNQLRHADVPELGAILKAWLSDGTPYVAPVAPPSPPRPVTRSPEWTAKIAKLVEAFAGLGVFPAQLEERLGHPVHAITDAELIDLRAYYEQKKALASESAEQKAKRLEQEKAEAGIAAEKAFKEAQNAKAADPKTVAKLQGHEDEAEAAAMGRGVVESTRVQSKEVQRNAAFTAMALRIKEATTPDAVTLILAEAPAEKLFGPGEVKALTRCADDRRLILKDAAERAAKPKKLQIEDVPF